MDKVVISTIPCIKSRNVCRKKLICTFAAFRTTAPVRAEFTGMAELSTCYDSGFTVSHGSSDKSYCSSATAVEKPRGRLGKAPTSPQSLLIEAQQSKTHYNFLSITESSTYDPFMPKPSQVPRPSLFCRIFKIYFLEWWLNPWRISRIPLQQYQRFHGKPPWLRQTPPQSSSLQAEPTRLAHPRGAQYYSAPSTVPPHHPQSLGAACIRTKHACHLRRLGRDDAEATSDSGPIACGMSERAGVVPVAAGERGDRKTRLGRERTDWRGGGVESGTRRQMSQQYTTNLADMNHTR